MGTVVQREGWCAGVWAAVQRGLSIQQKWTDKVLGKLGERKAGLVPGMGSAAALVRAGGQLAGSSSAGKELCCREKLVALHNLNQIRTEAVHGFISDL